MVGGRGGQNDYLADYSSIGITPGRAPRRTGETFIRTLNDPRGLQFHSDSAFFEGLYRELNPEARGKIDGTIFCARSGDDTQNNPHSPLYWIAKAQIMNGKRGELAGLVGTRGSVSGGNATAPVKSVDPMLRPVQINSASDALNLVNVGALPGWVNGDGATVEVQKSRVERILATVNAMSSEQLDRFSRLDLPSQVRSLVDCGYIKSKDSVQKYMGGGAAVDASAVGTAENPNPFRQIFALDQSNTTSVANGGSGNARTADASNRLRNAAGVAKLVLSGLANAGAITFGGYDYHNNPRNTTDDRDRQAGHVLGAIFNAAAAVGQDCMVMVYTDGGLSSGGIVDTSNVQVLDPRTGLFTANAIDKFQFNGDNGTKSSAVIFTYRHKGLRLSAKHQVGWYNSSASVERTASLISDNVENLVKAVVANYLSVAGKEGSLVNVVGDNPFGGNLTDVLALSNWGK